MTLNTNAGLRAGDIIISKRHIIGDTLQQLLPCDGSEVPAEYPDLVAVLPVDGPAISFSGSATAQLSAQNSIAATNAIDKTKRVAVEYRHTIYAHAAIGITADQTGQGAWSYIAFGSRPHNTSAFRNSNQLDLSGVASEMYMTLTDVGAIVIDVPNDRLEFWRNGSKYTEVDLSLNTTFRDGDMYFYMRDENNWTGDDTGVEITAIDGSAYGHDYGTHNGSIIPDHSADPRDYKIVATNDPLPLAVGDVVITSQAGTLDTTGQAILVCDGSDLDAVNYPELDAVLPSTPPTYSNYLVPGTFPYRTDGTNRNVGPITGKFLIKGTVSEDRVGWVLGVRQGTVGVPSNSTFVGFKSWTNMELPRSALAEDNTTWSNFPRPAPPVVVVLGIDAPNKRVDFWLNDTYYGHVILDGTWSDIYLTHGQWTSATIVAMDYVTNEDVSGDYGIYSPKKVLPDHSSDPWPKRIVASSSGALGHVVINQWESYTSGANAVSNTYSNGDTEVTLAATGAASSKDLKAHFGIRDAVVECTITTFAGSLNHNYAILNDALPEETPGVHPSLNIGFSPLEMTKTTWDLYQTTDFTEHTAPIAASVGTVYAVVYRKSTHRLEFWQDGVLRGSHGADDFISGARFKLYCHSSGVMTGRINSTLTHDYGLEA